MHSPRLVMKKKTMLGEPTPKQPPHQTGSGGMNPSPKRTNLPTTLEPLPVQQQQQGGMSSDALNHLLGKYRSTSDVDIVETDLSAAPIRSSQEVGRIAQAIFAKGNEPPAAQPKPYEAIGSRVFDYMKKPPNPPDFPRHVNPAGTTSPRQPSFTRKSSALDPLLAASPQVPIVADNPPMYSTGGNTPKSAKLLPIHPDSDGDSHPKRSPLVSPRNGDVAAVPPPSLPVRHRYAYGMDGSDESAALTLLPAVGGKYGALSIVQSPNQVLPAPLPQPTPTTAAAGGAINSIESEALLFNAIKDELEGPIHPMTSSGPVTEDEIERRRGRYVQLLNNYSAVGEGEEPPVEVTDNGEGGPDLSGGANTRLTIAKKKNQIAFLCQQLASLLASTSLTPLDVTIAQNNGLDVVWRASTEDVRMTLALEGDVGAVPGLTDADEAWLLGSNDAGGPEEDISKVKMRARKAFMKTVSAYKGKITQQREAIAKLKVQLAGSGPGGNHCKQLEDDLHIVRDECRRQMGKIKTLVSLLDRAGQTIRFHEDQRQADALVNATRKSNAPNWPAVRRIAPNIDVEPPRTDALIFSDILRFMEAQEDKISEYASSMEQLTQQLEEATAAFGAMQKTCKGLQRDLGQTRTELEALRQRRRFEQEERSSSITIAASTSTPKVSHLSSPSISHNPLQQLMSNSPAHDANEAAAREERAKMVERISKLEKALRHSTESKPTFTALGVTESVPPYLRYRDGDIRNIQLSKMQVENIISGIWLTRFLASVATSKPIIDAGWVSDVSVGTNPRPSFENGATVVKCLDRMFTLAVQAAFSAAMQQQQSNGFYGGLPSGGGAGGTATPSHATQQGTPNTVPIHDREMFFVVPTGLVLAEDRHLACDFMDENNIELWTVKRSEAKRMVNMVDHVSRFFLECIQASACKTCLTLYTPGTGITTPPIATLQWQKRAELFLQCPQVPSLFRPQGVALPLAVAEVTYSFLDGCEKFNFDGDVNMFRRVIDGELPEAAYYDMMLMIEKLRMALLNSHSLYAAPYRWPSPTIATVVHMLRRFFPRKSTSSLLQLQRCLLLDLKETALNTDAAGVNRMVRTSSSTATMIARGGKVHDDLLDEMDTVQDLPLVDFGGRLDATVQSVEALRMPVDIMKLFSSTESGNQGYFLEALKSQYMQEMLRYFADVREAIGGCVEELVKSPTGPAKTGVAMIDDQPLTVLEQTKRRRASVARFFDKQAAADGDDDQTVIPLRMMVDRLRELDPDKPIPEIENYVYHVLQIYLLLKSKAEGHTPVESELFNLSKEELWKRQTRASTYGLTARNFNEHSMKVLYRRSSVDVSQ